MNYGTAVLQLRPNSRHHIVCPEISRTDPFGAHIYTSVNDSFKSRGPVKQFQGCGY